MALAREQWSIQNFGGVCFQTTLKGVLKLGMVEESL